MRRKERRYRNNSCCGSREHRSRACGEQRGGDGSSWRFHADEAYEPVTITLNLERSGLGENVEYTFTEKPSAVAASGDQMADFFFDLGLEDQMAGYTKGSCWSTVSQYPARDKVPQLLEAGKGISNLSKEELWQPDVIS